MKTSAIIGMLLLGLLMFGSSTSFAADQRWAWDPEAVQKMLYGEKTTGPQAVSIVQDPTAVGTPVGKRGPETVKFTLEIQEVLGILDAAAKTTYTYWTFNGKVPGPMLRARVGDTIEITLKNAKGNSMIHNIDLHAVWRREVVCLQGNEPGFVCLSLRYADNSAAYCERHVWHDSDRTRGRSAKSRQGILHNAR